MPARVAIGCKKKRKMERGVLITQSSNKKHKLFVGSTKLKVTRKGETKKKMQLRFSPLSDVVKLC